MKVSKTDRLIAQFESGELSPKELYDAAYRNAPKYGNKRGVEFQGDKFDSQGELDRFLELSILERAGVISKLRHHVTYAFTVNGVKVGSYEADYVYEEKGRVVVEDFKQQHTRTEAYQLRKKLMLACHGITIRESFSDSRR